MKYLLAFVLIIASAQVAMAATETCGWEGTETILGSYNEIIATISTEYYHGGSQSLCLEHNDPDYTPQAYVAWIVGLSDGDEVTTSFWRYDTTPNGATHTPPSCRIWAHWNDDPDDINEYNGTASGNTNYGPGTGWDETSHTWTVVDGHTGIVIQARVYSSPGDIVWIDDMTITAPNHAEIRTPENYVSLQQSTWADIKAAF